MLLLIFGERKSDYYLSLPSHFLHELHLRVEFAIDSLSTNPRYQDSIVVTGILNADFYCGTPLIWKLNEQLQLRAGALCLLDTKAHPEFSLKDTDYLIEKAAEVTNHLKTFNNCPEHLRSSPAF